LNLIVFVELGSVEDILELAFVKPQTIASAAFIYEQGGFGRANDDFLHFFVANRTFPHFFGAYRIDFERIKHVFSLVRLVKQKFKLTGVQPDAAAVGAIIYLYTLEFKRDHRIFTSWTIHISKLKIQEPKTSEQSCKSTGKGLLLRPSNSTI
jgi:hypothetical protein